MGKLHSDALGVFLRRVRKLRALTQPQVADAIGCDVNTVRNAEAGRNITLSTLYRLSVALRVPLERLARVATRGRP